MLNIVLLLNYTDKSVTSVQNRLISAREQMTAKSRNNREFNVSKSEIIKIPSTCECKQTEMLFILLLFTNITREKYCFR